MEYALELPKRAATAVIAHRGLENVRTWHQLRFPATLDQQFAARLMQILGDTRHGQIVVSQQFVHEMQLVSIVHDVVDESGRVAQVLEHFVTRDIRRKGSAKYLIGFIKCVIALSNNSWFILTSDRSTSKHWPSPRDYSGRT